MLKQNKKLIKLLKKSEYVDGFESVFEAESGEILLNKVGMTKNLFLQGKNCGAGIDEGVGLPCRMGIGGCDIG